MKIRSWYSFAKKKNLFNRIYDMLEYFELFDVDKDLKSEIKYQLKSKLADISFVENLITYFEKQIKKNRRKIEVKCNLLDLINDLDYLKQYLDNQDK